MNYGFEIIEPLSMLQGPLRIDSHELLKFGTPQGMEAPQDGDALEDRGIGWHSAEPSANAIPTRHYAPAVERLDPGDPGRAE
jgi:hypothetical protein